MSGREQSVELVQAYCCLTFWPEPDDDVCQLDPSPLQSSLLTNLLWDSREHGRILGT